jgi:hypothetical protein
MWREKLNQMQGILNKSNIWEHSVIILDVAYRQLHTLSKYSDLHDSYGIPKAMIQ